MKFGSILLVSLLFVIFACQPKEKNLPADEVNSGPRTGVTVTITEDPLAIDFYYGDRLLTRLAEPEHSAIYLVEGMVRTDLVGPPSKRQNGNTTVLGYSTIDGRRADLSIILADDGSARIELDVEDKDEREKIGSVFQVAANEGFYGLIERPADGSQYTGSEPEQQVGIDLRGQHVFLYTLPTISTNSPFYVSSAGYGVYYDSDWPANYDFAQEEDNVVRVEYEGDHIALQVFGGNTPLEVTANYATSICPSILPPEWTFRPWRWRNDHYDLPQFYEGTTNTTPYNSMVVEDVLMMQALDLPLSLYWVDRPWGPGYFGYDDLEWDEERLPNPVEMVEWLNGKNIELMLWLAPWAVGAMAQDAVDAGYTVENATPAPPIDGYLIDLTNPDAVSWWQDYLIKRIDDGVRGFKLDRGEEKNPDGLVFDGEYFDGRSYREVHNEYPALYAAAVRGAFDRAGVEDFVVMPRSGWVGTQQHAVIWGGDTPDTEFGLRTAIIGIQRLAAMNFPVFGSDTCGYGFAEHEVCARWLAFSAFSPLMELGPFDNLAPWSMVPEGESGGVNAEGYGHEPFYNEELLAVMIFYARLHNDLAEYSYAQAELASENGTPFVRPMIFMHPENAAYRDLYNQYYYGPDILVAPIWQKGTSSVEVMIPPGEWIDAWSGELTTGETTVSIETPIYKVPIFVRNGSGIDLGNLPQRYADAVEKAKYENRPNLSTLIQTVE